MAFAAILAVCLIPTFGCDAGGPASSTESTDEAKVEDNPSADLDRLIGRWQRPDGGYVLEIGGVAADGEVQAAYLNPQPIRISTATAESWRGSAQLFVEFDDVNYRGSTYQLIHDPERDILFGTYYQAAMGQTFEVYFVRLR